MGKRKKNVVITVAGSWSERHRRILEALGAEVVEVVNLAEAKLLYRVATHVLLQGGPDIHPRWYQQHPTFSDLRRTDSERDQTEYALAWSALKHGKPLMGVCRGHQMVAVAAGAVLIQDIEKELGLHHLSQHGVRTGKGTLLRRLLGTEYVVNSYHHQAVERAPAGLHITARSLDGLIEGMESERVLTVQWHPEAMIGRQESMELFYRFLRMKPGEGSKGNDRSPTPNGALGAHP